VETAGLLVCVEVLLQVMARHLPALAEHLAALDFSLDLVLFGWFQSLLFSAPLPRATRARVFDWWMATGDMGVFIRIGLSIHTSEVNAFHA
jgi:Rab-GTPase-TBC domain